MATYYWVGGSGTWDASTTTNWASSSGGGGSAGVPTLADNVIFDANSNTLASPFTVTISTGAVCNDFSTGGAGGALDGAMTLAGTVNLSVYGSLTFPVANLSFTNTSGVTFRATTTGKTVTFNGVTPNAQFVTVAFDGVGGEWTLGSALTVAGQYSAVRVNNGSFITSNYNVTAGAFGFANTTSVKSATLGSSTITVNSNDAVFSGSVWWVPNSTNLTFNADTSTIVVNGRNLYTNFGSNLTYYNVSFLPASGGFSTSERQINGTNVTVNTLRFGDFTHYVTVNTAFTGVNLTVNARTDNFNSAFVLASNLTFSGAVSIGSGATTVLKRATFKSNTIGTQRTISAGSLTALVNADFQDIATAGVAGTWTGTSVGNCFGNSGITFTGAKTVYWNLAGTQNWTATGWATTNNGAPAAANLPLPQDTATFTEAGAAGTITIDVPYNLPAIQMADGVSNRTTTMTLATGAFAAPFNLGIYGSVTFFSSLTLSGTGSLTFGIRGTTQTVTSAGKTWTQPLIVNAPTGTIQFVDNSTLGSTLTFTLTNGTLDLNGQTLSTGLFSSTNSNTRVIAFGAGNITTTGSGAVWNTGTVTNFSYTGTPTVNISNNSATATTVATGALSAAQALDFNYTVGTYTLTDTTAIYKSVSFTGFAGTIPNAVRTIYGSLTLSSGMTLTAGANATTFASTVAGNTITSAGKTQDYPITFNGVGGVWTCQDALTQGSTRTLTLTNGILALKNGVTSTVGVFATSGANQKYLQSSFTGSQATLSQVSGIVNAQNLDAKDIAATGGAKWNLVNASVNRGNVSGWYVAHQQNAYFPAGIF